MSDVQCKWARPTATQLTAAPCARVSPPICPQNSVEPFLEPALAICAALLHRRRESRGAAGTPRGAARRAEALLKVTPVLVELLPAYDAQLAEMASECLVRHMYSVLSACVCV